MDIVIFLLGWGAIAAQTWAMKRHFNMKETPQGVKVISALVLASAFSLSYLGFAQAQPLWAQLAGLGVQLSGLLVFWLAIRESAQAKLLAAFDGGLPHGLLTTGPYGWVRHPFYTSYILHWAGGALGVCNLWGLGPGIAMTTSYFVAARDEEQKFERTEMAAQYADYRLKTGRFFPKLF